MFLSQPLPQNSNRTECAVLFFSVSGSNTYAILFELQRPGYSIYLCLIPMSSSSNLKDQTPKCIIPGKKYKVCIVINCNNNLKSIDKRTNKHVKLHGFPDSTKV